MNWKEPLRIAIRRSRSVGGGGRAQVRETDQVVMVQEEREEGC